MSLDLILVTLAFHYMAETDWFLCGGSDDLVSYNLVTGAVAGYPTERIVLSSPQKIDDCPVMTVKASPIVFKWLSGVKCRTNFENERNYRRFRGINDDDAGNPADVSANAVDDVDEIFA